MKTKLLTDRFGDDESSTNDQMTEAISEALSANDKVIEIKPAKQSRGIGLKSLLLAGAAAVGIAYWARNSQKPDELVGSVKEKTADRTHQAAETIQEGSETASDRIEEGSDRAGEAIQEVGETAAERAEEAGEEAAERTEEAGEGADESGSDASGSSTL